jgi:glycosyltransferase involved in cell wall biosynthesis
MDKKTHFLFYLYLDWDHCYQRGLIKAIAKEVYPSKVVCIERPADLFIGLLKSRKRLYSMLLGKKIRKITDNLIVVRPFFFLNDYVASWVPFLNRIQCVWLRYLLNHMGIGPTSNEHVVLWLYSPIHWPFSQLYSSAYVVYQLVDEYTLTAQGKIRRHQVTMEKKMLKKCHVVFTISELLASQKKRLHTNVHCIGQGTSFDLLSMASKTEFDLPDDIKNIPCPRIGLVGNIRDWIDFQLVQRLLETRSDWSIVFIGSLDPSATSEVNSLMKFKNFFWLGEKPFQELYRWLSGLDVGIIPYVQTEFTKYINPAKLYEYFATGLPVVSTNIGELQPIENCLWIAKSYSSFEQSLHEALQLNVEAFKERRVQIAKNNSFENIAKRVLKQLSLQ